MAAITFGIQDVPTKRAVAELQRQIDALKKENTTLAAKVSARSQPQSDTSGIEADIRALQTSVGALQTSVTTLPRATYRMATASKQYSSSGSIKDSLANCGVTLATDETPIGIIGFNLGSTDAVLHHANVKREDDTYKLDGNVSFSGTGTKTVKFDILIRKEPVS